RRLHDDQPYTFLWEPRRLTAVAADLEAVEIRPLGASALLTALILVLSFGLAEALPGGPGGVAEDPRVSPAQAERLRAAWGLDRPVTERFLRFVGGTVRGDWGPSLSRQRPVAEVLADAIPWT